MEITDVYTGVTVTLSRYDTVKGTQIYLRFNDAEDYLDGVHNMSVVVIGDKAYFELNKGNKMLGKSAVISKKSQLKDFETFANGVYPLRFDNDMGTYCINCRNDNENSKDMEGKNMNLAGSKNTTKTQVPPLNVKTSQGEKKEPEKKEPEKKEPENVVQQKTEEVQVSIPNDYQTTIIDLMSAWTADMMKNKKFDTAKKLIDLTTEIADL